MIGGSSLYSALLGVLGRVQYINPQACPALVTVKAFVARRVAKRLRMASRTHPQDNYPLFQIVHRV